MSAKEYLIDKRIFSKQVLDSGLLNTDELIELMEGYAASKPYSPEVARRLIDFKKNILDKQEAFTKFKIDYKDMWAYFSGFDWAEMERIANIKPGGE